MQSPGQEEHMEGCLITWEEAVDHYLDEVQTEVTNGDLLHMYHQVLKYLGSSCQTHAGELEEIASFTAPQDLVSKMKQLTIH